MIEITESELLQCKRALVVLNETAKTSFEALSIEAPLQMKQDILTLTKVLRRLERIAQKKAS